MSIKFSNLTNSSVKILEFTSQDYLIDSLVH